MAWRTRLVGWAIVLATVSLAAMLVSFEVYIWSRTKVSPCVPGAHDGRLGAAENTERTEVDDVPARLARVDSVCKKYAALLCKNRTHQRTRQEYLHCGGGEQSFYLVENRRLGFCSIPKAATSSLKALILEAEHAKDPGDNADKIFYKFWHRFRPILPTSDLAKKLGSEYTKLIVVRHPFQRLVSAYVDKIRTTHPYINSAKKMYKSGFVGKGPNGTFTFAEFVNNILEQPVETWDEHWAPFTPRCRPCSMRYNFIAKVETLDRDLEALLPRIGLSGWAFPKRNAKAQNNDTRRGAISQHLSELSRQQLLELHAIYLYDFELFGYKLEGYTDPVL